MSAVLGEMATAEHRPLFGMIRCMTAKSGMGVIQLEVWSLGWGITYVTWRSGAAQEVHAATSPTTKNRV